MQKVRKIILGTLSLYAACVPVGDVYAAVSVSRPRGGKQRAAYILLGACVAVGVSTVVYKYIQYKKRHKKLADAPAAIVKNEVSSVTVPDTPSGPSSLVSSVDAVTPGADERSIAAARARLGRPPSPDSSSSASSADDSSPESRRRFSGANIFDRADPASTAGVLSQEPQAAVAIGVPSMEDVAFFERARKIASHEAAVPAQVRDYLAEVRKDSRFSSLKVATQEVIDDLSSGVSFGALWSMSRAEQDKAVQARTAHDEYIIHSGSYDENADNNTHLRYACKTVFGYLHSIQVKSEERMGGLGKLLMTKMIDLLHEKGVKNIRFTIEPCSYNTAYTNATYNEEFIKLIEFYKKFGAHIPPHMIHIKNGRLYINRDGGIISITSLYR